MKTYYVYLLASHNRVLYCGITNDLRRRLAEHASGDTPGFTSRYNVHRLVHYETFGEIRDAIEREKQIKRWRREKRVRLIESHNPDWADLSTV
ncbi:MAG: GIY-YIG nuclease family protein [Bacteroidota bacterium]